MTINQGFAKNGYRHLVIFTHLYPKYVLTKRKWGLQKYGWIFHKCRHAYFRVRVWASPTPDSTFSAPSESFIIFISKRQKSHFHCGIKCFKLLKLVVTSMLHFHSKIMIATWFPLFPTGINLSITNNPLGYYQQPLLVIQTNRNHRSTHKKTLCSNIRVWLVTGTGTQIAGVDSWFRFCPSSPYTLPLTATQSQKRCSALWSQIFTSHTWEGHEFSSKIRGKKGFLRPHASSFPQKPSDKPPKVSG